MAFTSSKSGKDLLNAMEDVGFVGLGYWMSGMKYFSANKPLILPTDAKGLKFRVQTSDVAKAMIAAMDASPQPMAFAEVYGALQTGVVDGQENTWSNIYTKKFYEVQDSTTQTSHQLLAYLFMTSKEFLDSLEDGDMFNGKKSEPIDYKRNGVITLFVGVGLYLFGVQFVFVLKGVGLLVGSIGIGLIIAGYFFPDDSIGITKAVQDFEKE